MLKKVDSTLEELSCTSHLMTIITPIDLEEMLWENLQIDSTVVLCLPLWTFLGCQT